MNKLNAAWAHRATNSNGGVELWEIGDQLLNIKIKSSVQGKANGTLLIMLNQKYYRALKVAVNKPWLSN